MGTQCEIITVLRESPDATLRFVAWHLELGAASIRLFFDDPDDPAIGMLAHESRVQAARCGPEFWQSLGVAADAPFIKRQNAAFAHGYRTATAPWALVIDADEFVMLGGRSLDQFIATLPDVPAVRFSPAEAVRTSDGKAWFRVATSRRTLRIVYQEDRFLFKPRAGLIGHDDGKSMTRTGLAVSRVRQHWAVDADGKPINGIHVGLKDQALLLHYFDNGYDAWRRKFDWRASAWGFARNVSDRFDVKDESELPVLYERLHYLDDARLALLAERGGCVALPVDLDAVRERHFGSAAS